ncbi:hypothetical protein TNCV_3333891 [Trichonephila clavipes]|nr:hypothetical protein TNCV_3333891 [Trichonephila clavipes]
MDQYDDDKSTLPVCVHHDATKHGCDNLHVVKEARIYLKIWRLTIHAPRFIVDHTIEDTPVFDAGSSVAAAMVSELKINSVTNAIELFVQTLAVGNCQRNYNVTSHPCHVLIGEESVLSCTSDNPQNQTLKEPLDLQGPFKHPNAKRLSAKTTETTHRFNIMECPTLRGTLITI